MGDIYQGRNSAKVPFVIVIVHLRRGVTPTKVGVGSE